MKSPPSTFRAIVSPITPSSTGLPVRCNSSVFEAAKKGRETPPAPPAATSVTLASPAITDDYYTFHRLDAPHRRQQPGAVEPSVSCLAVLICVFCRVLLSHIAHRVKPHRRGVGKSHLWGYVHMATSAAGREGGTNPPAGGGLGRGRRSAPKTPQHRGELEKAPRRERKGGHRGKANQEASGTAANSKSSGVRASRRASGTAANSKKLGRSLGIGGQH